MLAREANRLGFQVHLLDQDPQAPAFKLADSYVVGGWADPAALRELAARVDVLTVERDDVGAATLRELTDAGHRVSPDPDGLAAIQDKLVQRERLAAAGLPGPRFQGCGTGGDPAELAAAARRFGLPLVQKLRRGGYDGRGVALLEDEAALGRLLPGPSLFEEQVALRRELAVMVALGAGSQEAVYPVCELVVDPLTRQLDTLIAPAELAPEAAARAQSLALAAARAFGGQGMFGVELFEDTAGRLLVNEVSPRPHNTGHYTIEACVTCQFEQHLRAICGLPLGSPELLRPAATANLVGAGTRSGRPRVHGLADALAIPCAAVHLYGKAEVRPNRKMGHVTALGSTRAEALERAQRAQQRIRIVAAEEDG